MFEVKIGGQKFPIEGYPNECPFCHKSITPNIIYGYFKDLNEQYLEVFMSCPDQNCKKSFIAYYQCDRYSGYAFSGETTKGRIKERSFSTAINELSPCFSRIYNQAFGAEQHDLSDICGVGYRKALEFLINSTFRL